MNTLIHISVKILLPLFLLMMPTISLAETSKKEQESLKAKVSESVEYLDKKIDHLKEKADRIGGDNMFKQWSQNLSDVKKDIEERMGKLQDSSEDAWKDIKQSVDQSLSEADQAFTELNREYRYWRVENDLHDLVEAHDDLEIEADSYGEEAKSLVNKGAREFKDDVESLNMKLKSLENTEAPEWDIRMQTVENKLENLEDHFNKKVNAFEQWQENLTEKI